MRHGFSVIVKQVVRKLSHIHVKTSHAILDLVNDGDGTSGGGNLGCSSFSRVGSNHSLPSGLSVFAVFCHGLVSCFQWTLHEILQACRISVGRELSHIEHSGIRCIGVVNKPALNPFHTCSSLRQVQVFRIALSRSRQREHTGAGINSTTTVGNGLFHSSSQCSVRFSCAFSSCAEAVQADVEVFQRFFHCLRRAGLEGDELVVERLQLHVCGCRPSSGVGHSVEQGDERLSLAASTACSGDGRVEDW